MSSKIVEKVKTTPGRTTASMDRWKLEDAKAHLSEVVRRAGHKPQLVTVRGKEAAVVLAPQDYHRLVGGPGEMPLTDFLATLDLGGIDLERSLDAGRDIDL